MSDTTTIARPYAKAIFELALSAKQLGDWSAILLALSEVMTLPDAVQFIRNPATTDDEQAQLLMTVATKVKSNVDEKLIQCLLSLLADNKRLLLIPGIFVEYERLRAKQEKTLVVAVNSYSPLSEVQQQQMIEKLTHRLQRRVELEVSIDETLLGGALIQAGDLVIDGSVRGQLQKLAYSLTEH